MAGYIGNQAQIRSGLSATIDELNIIDGVTATTAELNILDGVTSTATELNILDGVTATTAELNIMDGVTATAAEINLIDGGTARGTTAIADGDGVLINDAGTMRQTSVETLATYMGTKGLGPAYTRSATAPSSPNEGDWWFRNDVNILYIYDGTDGWLTSQDRELGVGRFFATNTNSLVFFATGELFSVRYEPEATMLIDKGNPIFHTFTDNASKASAVSNASRGVIVQNSAATTNAYAYVTIATAGAATDFGNAVTLQAAGAQGCDHATRGIFAGTQISGTYTNNMEYITIASAGNGTDFGNLTVARGGAGGQAIANTTRGVFYGGYDTSTGTTNVIDYVTIDSAGNATDFGDLTAVSYSAASACSIVRGLIFSGSGRNAIDYITIASAGNASDFGDHLNNTDSLAGWSVHNKLYAYYGRSALASQEKHTIATAANATSFTFASSLVGYAGSYSSQTTIKGWIAASG